MPTEGLQLCITPSQPYVSLATEVDQNPRFQTRPKQSIHYISITMGSHIFWPPNFLPGTTDNFVSNEVIVKGITVDQAWRLLVHPALWESYYNNCSQVKPPEPDGVLRKDATFSFSTFGFPPIQMTVYEAVEPTATTPGRLAWRATVHGDKDTALDVYHAWVVENLDWGVVRIFTQESQIGEPAVRLANTKPNIMLLGHQDWLDGIVEKAREERGKLE